MNLTRIADLLARRIGLDPAALGPSVLPAAVTDALRALGLTDPDAYADRLAERPDEFAALAERLVVPETWFFRGAGLFGELARAVATWPGRPFRALSLPCSTGEEPYSLAIALLEAGLDPKGWVIDALDLSGRLLEAARRGVYREFSFRQTDPALRARYFCPVAGGWELAPSLRGLVRFAVGNVLDPALPATGRLYDLVLCRNLLIYLTPSARQQAVATLERLVTPGGLLAVGHAEPQILHGRSFRRVGGEPHFLFRYEPACPAAGRKEGERTARAGEGGAATERRATFPEPPRSGGLHCRPAAGDNVASDSVAAPPAAEEGLTRARRLADSGRLDEALGECQAHLGRTGPSADAYSLLGLVRLARGERDEAAASFRKALYLDPEHREALTGALLLATQWGDGQAAALRARLARLPGGTP
jgi:chemotaxis protein methyltransferase WspC